MLFAAGLLENLQELVRVQWLAQKIDGAAFQCLIARRFVVKGSYEDNRHTAIHRRQLTLQLQPCKTGEMDVENEAVCHLDSGIVQKILS